jgi:hypothetical protein
MPISALRFPPIFHPPFSILAFPALHPCHAVASAKADPLSRRSLGKDGPPRHTFAIGRIRRGGPLSLIVRTEIARAGFPLAAVLKKIWP